jgi:3-deoxy-manno-octulosonate cytidylyltransferase (CMP-KDO synthetase)
MKISIVIPARYGSTRFPGKPLALIDGKSMLQRVYNVAEEVAKKFDNVEILVATEDQRIADHCEQIGASCVITPEDCPTGSDRVLAAIDTLDEAPDFVVNFQGDAPSTPPVIVSRIIETWLANNDLEVVTPVVQLDWDDLDQLRENKKTTPFSGTTCIRGENGMALWFSKNIIPAIRKEEALRSKGGKSPIFQHIGIYGFRTDILREFVSLPQSQYEQMEGLEQLRLLENGRSIFTVEIESSEALIHSGIDSPEDIERMEKSLSSIRRA